MEMSILTLRKVDMKRVVLKTVVLSFSSNFLPEESA